MMWGDDEDLHMCCACGEWRPCEYTKDPYLNEMGEGSSEDYWCEDCFDTRSGDI